MEDIVWAVSLFVGLPWALFSGIAKVKAAKAVEQGGLRASELEAIIRAAVADAVEPMRQRVETLEAIVTDDEPAGRLDPAARADALEPDALELDAPSVTQRRTRA